MIPTNKHPGTPEARTNIPARRVLLRCRPNSIAEIHAIVEAYPHIAVVRTLDADLAVVELIATPDTFPDALEVSRSLEKALSAEILHPRTG